MVAAMSWLRLLAVTLVVWTGCTDGSDRAADTTERASTPAARETAPVEADVRLIEIEADDVPELLRTQPGRVLLVNVWSTWCEPCVEELPELVRMARAYEGRGLGVLFVSADPRSQRAAALSFLREQGAPLPSYIKVGSDDAFIHALHPEWSGSLPATMLFDDRRRPRALWEERVDRLTLSGPIERLLASSE